MLGIRQTVDNALGVDGNANDAEIRVQGIGGIAHGFNGVAFGAIVDATSLVGSDQFALHDPSEDRMAGDRVVPGFLGKAKNRDVFVGHWKCHLGNAEPVLGLGVLGRIERTLGKGNGPGFERYVVEV